jgi:pimeloyl-ACP methyl ester carboxylesterase
MRHDFIDSAPATRTTLRLAAAGVVLAIFALLGPGRAAASPSNTASPGRQVFVRAAAAVQAHADRPLLTTAIATLVAQTPTARSGVPAAFPPSAGPAAIQDPCAPDAKGAVCGHVDVPLDRGDPLSGLIPIHFELHLHTDARPAKSAIIVNFGGPGASTTAMRSIPPSWFGAAYADHDVLLIDDRGTGGSGALDCPAYQHDTGPLLAIVGECATQLGASATDFSTAEVAADDDAIRAALGYNAVDFVGTSFGAVDASAYATRFPSHLRSVVLDSPVGEPDLNPIAAAAARTRRDVALIGVLCSRSRACGRSAAGAVDSVRWLVRRVRRSPVVGTGLDANGVRHHVAIDPRYLLVHILDTTPPPGGPFLTSAEIPAAAAALARGDAVPLLRLAAESDYQIPGDAGDATGFSEGAFSATLCLDEPWPWSPDASLAARQAQWAQAVSSTPGNAFAPFRPSEILFSVFGISGFCLPWPQTGTQPPIEPGASYPRVPALVLQGELDANGFVAQTARLFPEAKLITVTGAGHNTFAWDTCGSELTAQFLHNLKVTRARCASRSPMNYPGVTAFPRAASQSPAATPEPGNHAVITDLRIARVAADAALDALKRSVLGSGKGPGLRGGKFHADFGHVVLTVALTKARWTNDVAVSGTVDWASDSGKLNADLHIEGPRRQHGTIHMRGGWLIPSAARSIAITGTLDSTHLAATVPST